MPFLALLKGPNLILLAVVAIMSAGAATYVTREIYKGDIAEIRLAHTKMVAEQEREANAILQKSKDDVIAKEREFNAYKDEVEKKYAENQKRIDGLRIANGRLVAAAGGLFDRNGRPSGPSGGNLVSGNPGAAPEPSGAATGCRLSDEVTEHLLDLARDADAVAEYAALAHQWALELRRRGISPLGTLSPSP